MSTLPPKVLVQSQKIGLTVVALLSNQDFNIGPKETRSLLLLGSSGERFFSLFESQKIEEPDPLDSYTKRVVSQLVAATLPEALATYYPFEAPFLPFQRFALEAGLGRRSPLGILVSEEYGPWFALRAVVALPCQAFEPPTSTDLCLQCPAPCISACPATAVQREGLQVSLCGEARRSGPCQDRCVAREACPVGVQWRYQESAIRFHHRAASLFFP